MTEILTPHGAFWVYAAIASLGWLWFYWNLPETAGKTLEEIEQLFIRPSDSASLHKHAQYSGGAANTAVLTSAATGEEYARAGTR